jgi:hypothetical protein
VLLATPSLDNQNLLRALEIGVVVLIWLFFLRVIRAVWVEVKVPKAKRLEPEVVEAPLAQAPKRGKSRSLRLKVLEPDVQRGQAYDLADELTLGRAPGCGVRVEDAYTSSIHARLYRQNGTLWVEDLGSTNGTWVNAQRISSPTRLGKGDLLQVGGTVFEVDR